VSKNRRNANFGLSINTTVHLKYVQAFLCALKSAPFKCVLVICQASKSLNVNTCRVNSKILKIIGGNSSVSCRFGSLSKALQRRGLIDVVTKASLESGTIKSRKTKQAKL